MQPKPQPETEVDRKLWADAELRQAILDERWGEQVDVALASFYAPEVLARFSVKDLSRNPFLFAMRAINTLYDDEPIATAEDADLSPIATPELWALRQEAQLRANAMGESLIRLDIRDGRVRYRVVGAEYVELTPDPDRPGEVAQVRETRLRGPLDGSPPRWVRETWDPARGIFAIEERNPKTEQWDDATPAYYAAEDGPYPYLDADGAPILPYVVCHESTHGYLRRPGCWSSLVSATLGSAVLHTFWVHGLRDHANPQPILLDAGPVGAARDPAPGSATEVRSVVRDPGSFLVFRSANGTGGQVTQLGSSMDPMGVLTSIDAYVANALRDAGLGPTDEAPSKGVSGVAISVSREALRRSQRRQRPAAERADRQILATAARMASSIGVSLPTDEAAYSIRYQGIAPSTAEVLAAGERQRTLLDLGLTVRWMAIMEVHPHLSEQQAKALAAEIEANRAARARAMPAQPKETDQTQETDDAGRDGSE